MGAALIGGMGGGKAVAEPSPQVAVGPSAAVAVTSAEDTLGTDNAFGVIVLDTPATTDQVITARVIVVRGSVSPRTGRIQVLLQSRSAEPIVVRTAEPLDLPATRDRRQHPDFVVTLPLPSARPSGPAVVQVVTYDVSGRAIGIFVRRIQIGGLIDPTYGDEAARPPTGEDGLMGGIIYGTNFAWQSDGR